MMRRITVLILSLLLLAACRQEQEAAPTEAPPATAQATVPVVE